MNRCIHICWYGPYMVTSLWCELQKRPAVQPYLTYISAGARQMTMSVTLGIFIYEGTAYNLLPGTTQRGDGQGKASPLQTQRILGKGKTSTGMNGVNQPTKHGAFNEPSVSILNTNPSVIPSQYVVLSIPVFFMGFHILLWYTHISWFPNWKYLIIFFKKSLPRASVCRCELLLPSGKVM